MARIHAFEFNDQSWLPQAWRDYMTDFLQFGANVFRACEPALPIILEGLKSSPTQTIIDLGYGGGGGLLHLSKALEKESTGVTIRLTDLFPNHKAF